MKPSILLTGKIPSSVVATLESIGDLDQFRKDGVDVMPHDDLVARVAGKQALVSMITDAVDWAVIEAGTDLKIIANAAVGFNNIDVSAARKRGIIVTNTPGVLTDATADLTWALIAGAGLDVFEQEPKVEPELLTLENVLLIPHLGSGTVETRTAMADLAARNVAAVLSGEPAISPV